MQVNSHGRSRTPQRLTDLIGRPTVDVPKHNACTLPRRQQSQRSIKIVVASDETRLYGHLNMGEGRVACSTISGANSVTNSDTTNPSTRLVIPAKTTPPRHRLHERVLRNRLRLGPIADDRQDRIDGRRILIGEEPRVVRIVAHGLHSALAPDPFTAAPKSAHPIPPPHEVTRDVRGDPPAHVRQCQPLAIPGSACGAPSRSGSRRRPAISGPLVRHSADEVASRNGVNTVLGCPFVAGETIWRPRTMAGRPYVPIFRAGRCWISPDRGAGHNAGRGDSPTVCGSGHPGRHAATERVGLPFHSMPCGSVATHTPVVSRDSVQRCWCNNR